MNICRFSGENDNGYRKVGGVLCNVVGGTHKRVQDGRLQERQEPEELRRREAMSNPVPPGVGHYFQGLNISGNTEVHLGDVINFGRCSLESAETAQRR